MVFRYINTRHPIHQLRHEMDRLLTGLLGRATGWPAPDRGRPATNVWEHGDTVMVEMELPGLKSEQIEMSVSGGELTVKANRPEDQPEGTVYHRRERPRGASERALRLPADVDTSKVEANLADGVLTISLPKAESAKPRKISVAPQKTAQEKQT